MEEYLTGGKPTSTDAVILILTSDNQKGDCSNQRKDIYHVSLWQCEQVLCGCLWRGGGWGMAEYCFILHLCVEGLQERFGVWTQSSEEKAELIFCSHSTPDWCRAHRSFGIHPFARFRLALVLWTFPVELDFFIFEVDLAWQWQCTLSLLPTPSFTTSVFHKIPLLCNTSFNQLSRIQSIITTLWFN